MTPRDALTLLLALGPYALIMGRALLWRLVKLARQDELLGTVAWVVAVNVGLAASVQLSLRVGLLW